VINSGRSSAVESIAPPAVGGVINSRRPSGVESITPVVINSGRPSAVESIAPPSVGGEMISQRPSAAVSEVDAYMVISEVEQQPLSPAVVEEEEPVTPAPAENVADRAFARWMLESSIARADRERVLEGVHRSPDLTGPQWHKEAAKYGGSSMSVAGFNDGYDTPREFKSSGKGKDRLERNFMAAMEALEYFHRPWSVSPSVTGADSNPLTGWVSWPGPEDQEVLTPTPSKMLMAEVALPLTPTAREALAEISRNEDPTPEASPAVQRVLDVVGATTPVRTLFNFSEKEVAVSEEPEVQQPEACAVEGPVSAQPEVPQPEPFSVAGREEAQEKQELGQFEAQYKSLCKGSELEKLRVQDEAQAMVRDELEKLRLRYGSPDNGKGMDGIMVTPVRVAG